MFSLKGKRVLVTGASSGIGKQIAIDVASMGASVTLIGRNNDRLEEVMKGLDGDGHKCFAFDLTNSVDVESFMTQIDAFDGIVFNAGIIDYTPIKFLNDQKFDLLFDTNFKATAMLCHLLMKKKLVNKGGSIVFISSISSKLGVPGTALYASSKAALCAFSKVVASEVAKQKIRANTICPGIVVTPMTEQTNDVTTSDAEKAYPLGYGKPEDVAGLVVYLLSDESRWMTGSDLILDGGYTLN